MAEGSLLEENHHFPLKTFIFVQFKAQKHYMLICSKALSHSGLFSTPPHPPFCVSLSFNTTYR